MYPGKVLSGKGQQPSPPVMVGLDPTIHATGAVRVRKRKMRVVREEAFSKPLKKGPKGPFWFAVSCSEEEVPEHKDEEERNAHQPENQSPSH